MKAKTTQADDRCVVCGGPRRPESLGFCRTCAMLALPSLLAAQTHEEFVQAIDWLIAERRQGPGNQPGPGPLTKRTS